MRGLFMSKLRSINTIIWSDTWFETLSVGQKLLFIYLITNEKTNMLGVYEVSTRKISFETGLKETEIEKYLLDFEKSNKIKYKEHRVIMLNFLKHQNYNFNMMKSAIDIYNDLPSSLKIENINKIERDKEGFETLCKGFGMVRKVEVEVEDEIEDEDKNESELILTHPLQEFIATTYKNVSKLSSQLTYDECLKLLASYDRNRIADILLQMENKKDLTKKYTSVYLTALTWLKNDFSKGKTISNGQPSKMESMVNSAKEALNMIQDENT
jgi:hypothetical protein